MWPAGAPSAPPRAAHAATGPRGRAGAGPGSAGLWAPAVAAAAPRARVRPGLERGRGPGLYSGGGPSPAPARPPPRLPAPGGARSRGPASLCLRHAEGAWSILLSPGSRSQFGWCWGCVAPSRRPSAGAGGSSGTHDPAFCPGMTKLTQLPWPRRVATPCLSLPPLYTWAFCARQRGGHRGALRGCTSAPNPLAAPSRFARGVARWHSLSVLHLPPSGISSTLQVWHKLCSLLGSLSPFLAHAAPLLWRSHPVTLPSAPVGLLPLATGPPRVCPVQGWLCRPGGTGERQPPSPVLSRREGIPNSGQGHRGYPWAWACWED